MLNLTSEKLLASYKKSYNIDLVGLDNDLTMAESVKVLQSKYNYEFITSDLGISTMGSYFEKDVEP